MLNKELDFIDNNYEPFCSEKNGGPKAPNPNLNLTMHNFDIISQMVTDVPTQAFRVNSSNPSLSKFSSTANTFSNNNKQQATLSNRFANESQLQNNSINQSVREIENKNSHDDSRADSSFRKRKLEDFSQGNQQKSTETINQFENSENQVKKAK